MSQGGARLVGASTGNKDEEEAALHSADQINTAVSTWQNFDECLRPSDASDTTQNIPKTDNTSNDVCLDDLKEQCSRETQQAENEATAAVNSADDDEDDEFCSICSKYCSEDEEDAGVNVSAPKAVLAVEQSIMLH
jgi:hypothetical protein